jgi:leucine dehydrogenase
MKASAKVVWGNDSLTGKRVAMQGFGKVATYTAHHLIKEDSHIVVTDINEDAMDRARKLGLEVVAPDEIYDVDCDIFSPCALGGVINPETIPRIKARIVAGGANNQLLTEADGEELHRRGVLYAPDYLINAGGIINVSAEIGATYSADRAREKTERIYELMSQVAHVSKKEEISTAKAADRIAEQRLASVRAIKPIYRGR